MSMSEPTKGRGSVSWVDAEKVISGSNYVAGLEAEIARLKHEAEDAQAYIAAHDQALESAKAEIARLKAANEHWHERMKEMLCAEEGGDEGVRRYAGILNRTLNDREADIARLEAALAEADWLIHNNPLDGPDSVGWVERHESWLSTPAAQRGKATAEEITRLKTQNERVEDQTLTAPVSFPSPPEPNRIATTPDPVSPIRDKNILPTGKVLWITNGSGRVGAALCQLATVEAVCRWIENPPRVMAAGTMVSILRADAQDRVDEAQKEI